VPCRPRAAGVDYQRSDDEEELALLRKQQQQGETGEGEAQVWGRQLHRQGRRGAGS
jgi:hypothetical protein